MKLSEMLMKSRHHPIGCHNKHASIINRRTVRLDCSLLGAIGNALYESSGRSLHRPTYACY